MSWAAPQFVHALVVMLFFAVVGTLIGVVVRSPHGTFLVGTVAAVAAAIAARSDVLERLSPASWAATWMGFEKRQYLYDHVLWPEGAAGASAWTALAALIVLSTVLLVSAIEVTIRRDLV